MQDEKEIKEILDKESIEGALLVTVTLRLLFWVSLTVSLAYIISGALLWGFHVNPSQAGVLIQTYLPFFLYGMAGFFLLGLAVSVVRSQFSQVLWKKYCDLKGQNSGFLSVVWAAFWQGQFRRSHKEKWFFLVTMPVLVIVGILVHKTIIHVKLLPVNTLLIPLISVITFVFLMYVYNAFCLFLNCRRSPFTLKLSTDIKTRIIISVSYILIFLSLIPYEILAPTGKVSPHLFHIFNITVTLLGAAIFLMLAGYALHFYCSGDYKEKRESVNIALAIGNGEDQTFNYVVKDLDCERFFAETQCNDQASNSLAEKCSETLNFKLINKPKYQVSVEDLKNKMNANDDVNGENGNDWVQKILDSIEPKDIPDFEKTVVISLKKQDSN